MSKKRLQIEISPLGRRVWRSKSDQQKGIVLLSRVWEVCFMSQKNVSQRILLMCIFTPPFDEKALSSTRSKKHLCGFTMTRYQIASTQHMKTTLCILLQPHCARQHKVDQSIPSVDKLPILPLQVSEPTLHVCLYEFQGSDEHQTNQIN